MSHEVIDRIPTRDVARQMGMKTRSVTERVRREKGTFFGVTPIRLPSGRLVWPADAVEKISAQRKAWS